MIKQLLLFLIFLILPPAHCQVTARHGMGEVMISDFPTSGYVLRTAPFELYCRALNAASIRFRCNGKWIPEARQTVQEGTDEVSRLPFLRASVNISRVDSEEGEERCECLASGIGETRTVRSDEVRVAQAFMRKHFVQTATSQRVREGSTVALSCIPPESDPPPTIEWTKDGNPIKQDGYVIVASDGSLLLSTSRLVDQGSYSCHASNMAGKRSSPPATVHVYVDGDWSVWSDWAGACLVDCDALRDAIIARGEQAMPRITRRRTCNNPAPLNGGLNCVGSDEEHHFCPLDCVVDGMWTEWQQWGECSSSCERKRARNCTAPAPMNGGRPCPGQAEESVPCATGVCAARSFPSNWELILASLLCFAVLFAVIVSLCLFIMFRQKAMLPKEQIGAAHSTTYYGDVASYKCDPHKGYRSVDGDRPPGGLALFMDSPIHTSMTMRSNRSGPYVRGGESGYHTVMGHESRQALLQPDGSSSASSARRATLRTGSSLSEEENYATVYDVYECMDDNDTRCSSSRTGGPPSGSISGGGLSSGTPSERQGNSGDGSVEERIYDAPMWNLPPHIRKPERVVFTHSAIPADRINYL